MQKAPYFSLYVCSPQVSRAVFGPRRGAGGAQKKSGSGFADPRLSQTIINLLFSRGVFENNSGFSNGCAWKAFNGIADGA